jgi:hypothetical protein
METAELDFQEARVSTKINCLPCIVLLVLSSCLKTYCDTSSAQFLPFALMYFAVCSYVFCRLLICILPFALVYFAVCSYVFCRLLLCILPFAHMYPPERIFETRDCEHDLGRSFT